MRLAWRSRARAEFLEFVRAELAITRDELRAGVAAIETELVDARERLDDVVSAMCEHLDRREAATVARQAEVLAALERSTQAWHSLYTSGLEHHEAFLGALGRLNTMLSHALPQLPADPVTAWRHDPT